MMMTYETKEVEASADEAAPVDGLVMRNCSNCVEWQAVGKVDEKAECVERDRFTYGNNTCVSFKYDPSRFCTICGSVAAEGEHSSMNCTKNESHVASQWDYEWQDYSA